MALPAGEKSQALVERERAGHLYTVSNISQVLKFIWIWSTPIKDRTPPALSLAKLLRAQYSPHLSADYPIITMVIWAKRPMPKRWSPEPKRPDVQLSPEMAPQISFSPTLFLLLQLRMAWQFPPSNLGTRTRYWKRFGLLSKPALWPYAWISTLLDSPFWLLQESRFVQKTWMSSKRSYSPRNSHFFSRGLWHRKAPKRPYKPVRMASWYPIMADVFLTILRHRQRFYLRFGPL